MSVMGPVRLSEVESASRISSTQQGAWRRRARSCSWRVRAEILLSKIIKARSKEPESVLLLGLPNYSSRGAPGRTGPIS